MRSVLRQTETFVGAPVHRKPPREIARRFAGALHLSSWLPEAEYSCGPGRRGGELPGVREIAEWTAQLIDENLDSEVEREFHDHEGLDGQKIGFEDGERAEMGCYYVCCGLYDDRRTLWGDRENLKACYLWPAARSLIRALERTPKGRVVAFLRPPEQYLPSTSLASFTAVYNAACVRATEYLHEDHGPSLLLDTISGVKGHGARLHEA